MFLDLLGSVAARVLDLPGTLPDSEFELLDEAVAVLVSTLQSPDLSRWLTAQGSAGGVAAELARLKREVIEAEQVLESLMRRLGGGDGGASGSLRFSGAEPGEQGGELATRIEEQAGKARMAREAFRAERRRLIEVDPTFRSAFELPGMDDLRRAARHGEGAALLCLLELPVAGQQEPRSVGALIHADGRRTQQLQFEGLHATARSLVAYEPYGNRGSGGALRRSEAAARAEGPQAAGAPSLLVDLQRKLAEGFWQVLQTALRGAGAEAVGVERVHVCGHGLLQQLPLGLRGAADGPGLELLAWPGLPYLRLAVSQARAGATAVAAPSRATRAPWLVGHDCAWNSANPLPMAAVEASLLRQLLQGHGQAVQPIGQVSEVQAGSAALVLCCHGAQAESHFDGALALGAQPLTVRQIVHQRLGPPLALLPACHAGETREDSAGNALGISAGFLLGGTKVVVASSKAVPDALMPWLTTLLVWHVVQGESLRDAATRAREQFAALAFPDGYRRWLQAALPQALAAIQPGQAGSEHEAARQSAAGQVALERLEDGWVWQGERVGLFSSDPHRATASVASHVLQPRPEIAAELAIAAREMAAFVFIYGVG